MKKIIFCDIPMKKYISLVVIRVTLQIQMIKRNYIQIC